MAGYRNRDAAFALAVFLARFWSAPQKLLSAFPIDRRALDKHEALGLSAGRVRGALAALVEVGFLDRVEQDPAKRYQRTADGLHRQPILHRFGGEYGVAFDKANKRAQARRKADPLARRPLPRPKPVRLPAANVVPAQAILNGSGATPSPPEPSPQLAHKEKSPDGVFLMGEQNRGVPESALEAALARLGRGMGL